MARPWYCSRLFWLGFPGLLLLLWMWGGYLRTYVDGWWDTPDAQYSFGWGCGVAGLCIQEHTWKTFDAGRGAGFHYQFEKLEPDEQTDVFPRAFRLEDDVSLPGFLEQKRYGFEVSLWFILLIYMAAWLGALVLWQRRKLRLSSPKPRQ